MYEPKYDEDGVNLGYLRRLIKSIEDNIPNATSDLTNDSNFVNATQMNKAINAIDTLTMKSTAIAENEDLNDYTTAGVYYSGTTTITNSLSHCPVTGVGFKLIVEYTTSLARITQTIKVNDGVSYVRTYTGSWGEWIRDIRGIELFYNASGSTSGDVTLSKSITNFNEIEIMYGVAAHHKSVKVPVRGTSLRVSLDGTYVGSANMLIGSQECTLSGTTLTRGNSAGKNINLSTNAITDNTTLNFAIYKIVGY